MTTDITAPAAGAAETALFLGEDWFDPLETGVRTRIRAFIEELLEAELEAALGRKRYKRGRTPEKAPAQPHQAHFPSCCAFQVWEHGRFVPWRWSPRSCTEPRAASPTW